MIRTLEVVQIPAGSVEYVEAQVVAMRDDDLSATDPAIALVADGVAPTWLPASWEGPAADGLARTDTPQTLAAGTYTVRVRLTDDPEAPIRDAYRLIVK